MEVLSSGVVALSLSLVRNACTISRSHPSRARPRAASLSLQASSTFLWERSRWTDITTTPEHHWICFTDLKGFVFPNLSYFRFWLHYNHEKPWNYLEKPWKPTKNHEKLWNYLDNPWKPTKKVLIFRYKQTELHHTIYIIIIIAWQAMASWWGDWATTALMHCKSLSLACKPAGTCYFDLMASKHQSLHSSCCTWQSWQCKTTENSISAITSHILF